MVKNEVDDEPDIARMAGVQQYLKILQRAVGRVDCGVVRYVVFMVGGRGHNRHEPDAVEAQIGVGLVVAVVDIVELLRDSVEIADAVAVAVVKRADEDFVVGAVVVVRNVESMIVDFLRA